MAGCLPAPLGALRPRPKLFIFLVAEQFRQVYLDRTTRWLETGGFRRLMEEGAYYPNCRMAASGFTASGLATLATGAYPQLHGIVADRWYDRKAREAVPARGELLEATTLADEIARSERSRIYSMALDESHASLWAGRAPAQMFWMDAKGQFLTRGSFPEWLTAHNRLNPLENLHNAKWLAVGAGSGVPPLRTLTFDAKRPEEFFELYRSSPFCQAAQFELLREMLASEKLGQGETLDFVFVSLGSMALLGYETGSNSPLMDQMVLGLDRQIQGTLEVLNKAPGKDNYNLVFAAAHGAPPEPDAPTRSSKTVAGESLARAVNKGLAEWIDKGAAKNVYVEKYIYPFLYLNMDALRKQNTAMRAVRKMAGELALRQAGVAGYFTADGDCSHRGAWLRQFQNSFHDVRSGDVMLSYEPECVEEYGIGRGISYGSLYNYDTLVPLFLYGAQFTAQVIERGIEAVDLAPTVARAAGASPPSSTTGEVLAEVFK